MTGSALVAAMLASAPFVGGAWAQSPSTTIASRTDLVEVNVTVRDKSHRPVTDLQRDDFEVFDEGRRQPLAVFVAEQGRSGAERSASPGTFTNQIAATDNVKGYAVILLDWLNTGWLDQAQARDQVVAMLREIGVEDRVALFVLDRGLRVVHDFTSDATALLEKLRPLKGRPTTARESSSWDAGRTEFETNLFGPPPERTQVRGVPEVTEQVLTMDIRVRDTLEAFDAIAAHLSGVPGRKSVIWLSAGFPGVIDSTVIRGAAPAERTYGPAIDQTIRRLNAADIAVHAVDARGLPVGGRGYVGTLQEFAQKTGGQLFRNRNDLATGVRRGLDDLRVTYRLGYYVPEAGSEYRRILVRVNRAGVDVRHRSGYFTGVPPEREARASLARALRSPVDAGGVPISVRARRTGKTIHLAVIVNTALFIQTSGSFDLIARFSTDVGTDAAPVSVQTAQVGQSEEMTLKNALELGTLTFAASVEAPDHAEALRVVLRDRSLGSIGTITLPLVAIPRE